MNETKNKDLVKQIMDVLNCFICKKKSVNPKIIPCCGAIGCESCIQDLLRAKNRKCPNCNKINQDGAAPIHLHFLEKMTEVIPCLNASLNNKNVCEKHSKQASFYCKTCNKALCSDCIYEEMIMKNKLHENHDIKKFEDMIKDMKKQLQKELNKLIKIMKMISDRSNDIINEEENLRLQKNSILINLETKFKEIIDKLEMKVKDENKLIENQINTLKKQNEKIMEYISLCKETLSSNDPQILMKSSIIKKEIEDFFNNMENVDFKISSIDIQNDLIPPFQMVRIEIPNFKKEQQKFSQIGKNKSDCNFLYSDKKLIYGNKWRVKIYPNGNLGGEGTHLSIFIELVRGCQNSKTYFYRIEIESQVPNEQNIAKQFSSIFENGDTWGWNKAVSLDAIYKNGYIRKDGTLSILFGIRPESYYQMYMDIKSSIGYTKNKFKKLKNQIVN